MTNEQKDPRSLSKEEEERSCEEKKWGRIVQRVKRTGGEITHEYYYPIHGEERLMTTRCGLLIRPHKDYDWFIDDGEVTCYLCMGKKEPPSPEKSTEENKVVGCYDPKHNGEDRLTTCWCCTQSYPDCIPLGDPSEIHRRLTMDGPKPYRSKRRKRRK